MVPLALLLAGQRVAYQVHGIIAEAEAGRTRRPVAALTFQIGVRTFRTSGVAIVLTGISPMMGRA